MWPLFVAFGAVAGLAGHLYNGTSLRTLAVMDRLDRWPIEVRAAAIGELVGALGFFVPTLIGGGDEIPQRTLAGGAVLAVLPLAFVLRFGLGAVSYAAPVPGGLFAPILVLGAQLGLFFGAFCRLAIPAAGLDPTAFAVVGMAAFFTAVVQAPVTGIVLVIEMTPGPRCSSQRRGLFCGNAGAEPAARRPDLRFLTGAALPAAAERGSLRRYSSGRCTSRK